MTWGSQWHVDLISGRDKISGEDDIFSSPRDPRDHLIQTFNRWEAETVPRDTLCYGWTLCAEAAAVGHGLWWWGEGEGGH